MDPEQDVQGTSSTPPEDSQTPPETASPAVTTEGVTGEEIVGDRPLKNLQAEWSRKQAALESRIDQLTLLLTQRMVQDTPPAPTPAPTPQSYTDEQLEQLAAAGHAWAVGQLTERKATRVTDQRLAAHGREQQAQMELTALFGRNPVLQDPSHPLTQLGLLHLNRLVAEGHSPQSNQTRLLAVRAAIAERPDLAAAPSAAGAPTPMPRTPAQVTQQIDASGRRPAASGKPGNVKLTARHIELARRYGVKDPEKAIRKFQERQEKGTSQIGVAGMYAKEDW